MWSSAKSGVPSGAIRPDSLVSQGSGLAEDMAACLDCLVSVTQNSSQYLTEHRCWRLTKSKSSESGSGGPTNFITTVENTRRVQYYIRIDA